MRVELQPAYVLHTRHYRDTSLLVDFLTPNYGLVSGVVRGVRSKGKVARLKRSLMQPLQGLLIGWHGKTALKTVTHFESRNQYFPLAEKRLFSALYVNELLTRLLHPYDESIPLYALYESTLQGLLQEEMLDVVLRKFELHLLALLGYGFQMDVESESGQPLQPQQDYCFRADQGFVAALCATTEPLFLGEDILSIARGDYSPAVRKTAKRLCRLALSAHLGSKPLASRELFR